MCLCAFVIIVGSLFASSVHFSLFFSNEFEALVTLLRVQNEQFYRQIVE